LPQILSAVLAWLTVTGQSLIWLLLMIHFDNFRMNTCSGRYGAAYNMVGLHCFNEELSLLPKNPTEAKLQATSTWGESTEPT
jgi:hypothetical protein